MAWTSAARRRPPIARDYGYTLAELRKLQEGPVTGVLRVELFFDEEAGNWHYRVPALHINGGGTPTRENAERDALSAIAFALEGDPGTTTPTRKPSPSM